MAVGFTAGSLVSTALAALVQFAVLPALDGFGALLRRAGTGAGAAGRLVHDQLAEGHGHRNGDEFHAASIAEQPGIVRSGGVPEQRTRHRGGHGRGHAVLQAALPPLSARVKIARLHALTRGRFPAAGGAACRLGGRNAWEARIYGRILALPASATMLDSAQLLATLSAGEEILRLRGLALRFGPARADAGRRGGAGGGPDRRGAGGGAHHADGVGKPRGGGRGRADPGAGPRSMCCRRR